MLGNQISSSFNAADVAQWLNQYQAHLSSNFSVPFFNNETAQGSSSSSLILNAEQSSSIFDQSYQRSEQKYHGGQSSTPAAQAAPETAQGSSSSSLILNAEQSSSIFDQSYQRSEQKYHGGQSSTPAAQAAPATAAPATNNNTQSASNNELYDSYLQEQNTPVAPNTYSVNQAANSNTQANTNSFINFDQNLTVGDVNVGILFNEPSLILALALIIEMIIPLPKGFKISALSPIFVGLSRKVNRPSSSDPQRSFAGFFLSLLILLVILFLVFTLDALSGPIFVGLSRKVNRPSSSDPQRSFAGFFLSLLILLVILFLVFTLDALSGFDNLVSLVVLIWVLDLKYPQDRAIYVNRALHEGFKEKAKNLLSDLVLRETSMLSPMGIAKAACEGAILRIFSGWFSVIVWYFIAGIEGAVLMQTINLLSQSYNYKLRGNHHFGQFIFRMHQLMIAIPAALLMVFLFVSKNPIRHIAHAKEGFNSFPAHFGQFIFRMHQLMIAIPAALLMVFLFVSKNPIRHIAHAKEGFNSFPAPISGLVLGAVGGSLNISLGGPRYYQGNIMRLPKLGGEHNPDDQSILYAMRKIRMCGLLLLVVSVLIDLNF